MRAAIIENNTIANIVEAASLADVEAIVPDAEVVDADALPPGVGIGFARDGEEWSPSTSPAPSYRSIDKVEAMGLIRTVTGMSAAEELAFRDDPNLALFWRIWREDVGNVIWRDHPLTAQILDAIAGAGYINEGQRQAILDGWPTA